MSEDQRARLEASKAAAIAKKNAKAKLNATFDDAEMFDAFPEVGCDEDMPEATNPDGEVFGEDTTECTDMAFYHPPLTWESGP